MIPKVFATPSSPQSTFPQQALKFGIKGPAQAFAERLLNKANGRIIAIQASSVAANGTDRLLVEPPIITQLFANRTAPPPQEAIDLAARQLGLELEEGTSLDALRKALQTRWDRDVKTLYDLAITPALDTNA